MDEPQLDYDDMVMAQMAQRLDAVEAENARLSELLGEPLRVIAVEAIREATGCPDLIGRDGERLTEKLLKKAAELLVPNI